MKKTDSLFKQLHEANEKIKKMEQVLEYIHEKQLVKKHGTAGILHQQIGFLINKEFEKYDIIK